jgi:hypothetical protein
VTIKDKKRIIYYFCYYVSKSKPCDMSHVFNQKRHVYTKEKRLFLCDCLLFQTSFWECAWRMPETQTVCKYMMARLLKQMYNWKIKWLMSRSMVRLFYGLFFFENFQFHLNYSDDFPHSPKKNINRKMDYLQQFKDTDVTYMILIKNYKITYLHSKGWG